MAVFMTDTLPKYDPQNLPVTVKRLHDYTVSLTEMLRFVLMNLDGDNVPGLDKMSSEISDTKGNVSKIEQTAEHILMRVENAEGDISTFMQTADSLTTRIQNAEGDLSTLTQTADSLAARVYSTELGVSSLTVTANSIETRVQDLNGKYSSLKQTADGFETRVQDLTGKYSGLKQTVDGFETRVQEINGNYSSLKQTVNGFESRVQDLNGKYSSLKQTVDGFDFTGMVTFRALEHEGGSIINGNNITTGDLHIASDGIGALYFYDGSVSMEHMVGAIEVYSNTYPDLFLESRNGNNIRILSAAQVAVEAGTGGHIYLNADDYIQLRAGGRDYYFRTDGIYSGGKRIVSV